MIRRSRAKTKITTTSKAGSRRRPDKESQDQNQSTLAGGITVATIKNWDLAIVWKQLEKDPKLADAQKALMEDAGRDKAVWPNPRMIDMTEKQALTDGERAMIVELFYELRKARCVDLVCEDILKFMDKIQLDQARERCEDPSASPLFAD